MDVKFWVHKDGWIYTGDKIDGARIATEEEIAKHQDASPPTDDASKSTDGQQGIGH